jgi:ribonuclease HepT-like protein
MAECRDKIQAKMEQIGLTQSKLPTCPLAQLNDLELAGVGGMLQSIYNGIENILRQIMMAHGQPIKDHSQWHQQLIRDALAHGFISEQTTNQLIPYLTFRHLYRNAYIMDLRADRMRPLIDALDQMLSDFKRDVLPA